MPMAAAKQKAFVSRSMLALAAAISLLACSSDPPATAGNKDAAIGDGPADLRADRPKDAGGSDAGVPDTMAPDTMAPDTMAPDTMAPDTMALDTMAPDTMAPDTMAPDTMAPDTMAPDTMAPDTMAPDTMAPDTMAPDTMAPDTMAPDTMAPDTMAPDTMAPDTMAPDTVPPGPTAKFVDIYVDNFCNMQVVPPDITVGPGQTVKITWRNRSHDYAVDVWQSYGGGYLDLRPRTNWPERFEWCTGPRSYTGYADISTACSKHRFLIKCK
jgi:pentapeptide MXKDX repeat protein